MAPRKKKNLVIVESPAKAKTINKYLGDDYEVVASKGHVRDLPKSRFGIDIENGWIPKYLPLKDRKDVLASLKKQAAGAHTVYLAPDPDREGEAIAWHLKESLGLKEEQTRRVTFNEITKTAVQKAFSTAGTINMDKVAAQEARRFLDRVVGYQLSPLLSRKLAQHLSAGRVQSVAVRLIVEREREIQAFQPEEYWKITALVRPLGFGENAKAAAPKAKGKGKAKPAKPVDPDAEQDGEAPKEEKPSCPKGRFWRNWPSGTVRSSRPTNRLLSIRSCRPCKALLISLAKSSRKIARRSHRRPSQPVRSSNRRVCACVIRPSGR